MAQFAGVFVGTFIAWAINNQLIAPFPNVHSVEHVWETFGVEIFASFLFVLCIMILVSTDTQFTSSDGQIWMAIPLCLIAVCVLTNLTLGTNPAQALAFQIAYYLFISSPEVGK